jgi:hypothetical protein
MSSRRLILMSGCLLVAGCVAMLWLQFRNQDRINYDSYVAIHVGMPRDEVQEILGGPPGAYVPLKMCVLRGHDPREEWDGAQAVILVEFDRNGRVVRKEIRTRRWEPYDPSIMGRVRAWLDAQ